MTKPTWNSNVQPRRVVKPTPELWVCACPPGSPGEHELAYEAATLTKLNPAYLVNCLDCGMRRP